MAQQRDLPFLAATAWVGRVGFAAMFGPLAFLFLIFPTGRPASRRWGWLLSIMLLAFAVVMIGFALTPGNLEAGFAELPEPVANPIGLPSSWKPVIDAITTAAGLVVAVGALLSVLSLIQRYRRAARLERQQIRWLAFLGVFLGTILVLSSGLIWTGVIDDEGVVSGLVFFAFVIGVFLGIPAVCGIAILRHGLWDLDVVVRKTVQYGLLVAGFVLVLGIVSSWRRSCSSVWEAASMCPRSWSQRSSRSGSPWCGLGRAAGRTGSSTASARRRTRCSPSSRSGSARRTRPRTCSRGWHSSSARRAARGPRRVWLRIGDEMRPRGLVACGRPRRRQRVRSRETSSRSSGTTTRSRCDTKASSSARSP